MKFPMKKKYRNRHLILEVLHNKYQNDFRPDMDVTDGRLTFTQIANSTNLSDEILSGELSILEIAGEAFYDEVRYTQYFIISQIGRNSFNDEKYLNLGKDDFWNRLKNYFSIVAIAISISALAWSIYSSNNSSGKMKQLENRIDILEKK